jgi:DNA-binding NarL/FixJ family response regulator/predicted negative regulator of RcsB-dependent stress response
MSVTVSQPGAPSTKTTFEDARIRYASGDLESARSVLEARRDPLDDRSFFLFATILIRSGDAARARVEIARRVADPDSSKSAARALILSAAAALSCDAPAEASRNLDRAAAVTTDAIDREEIALYRAAIAHRAGDCETFRAEIKLASSSADPVLYARARRLAGDVAAARSDFTEAQSEYRQGFSALIAARPIDDRLLAALAARIADANAECETCDHGVTLETIENRPWHPAMRARVGLVHYHGGLQMRRHGRHAPAAAMFLRAITMAGESPVSVAALGAASINARETREPRAAENFAAAALALADRIRWDEIPPAGHDALLSAALVAGRQDDVPSAMRLLERYAAMAPIRGRFSAGPRSALLRAHAHALVAALQPASRDEGVLELRRVRREWSQLGFVWRAIEARADLYAITGRHYLLEANRAQLRELLRHTETTAPVSPAPLLSPQQRRIAEAVAGGSSTDEIAIALGISARTVKNQLHKVYTILELEHPTREKLAAFVHSSPGWGQELT